MGRLEKEFQELRDGKQGTFSINSTIKKGLFRSPDHETELFLPLEILTRLPVKSLLRCKSVCKLWKTILEERFFIEEHRNLSEMVYEYRDEMTNETGDNEEVFECKCVLDGLLLERNNLTGKYRIRNPATKKILNLPDPGEHTVLYVQMFYVPKTGHYKLVNIYCQNGTEHGGCGVLSLIGTDLKWRALNIPSLYDLGFKRQRTFYINIRQMFYFIRICEAGFGEESEIVCLDVGSECYVNVKIPQAFFSGGIYDIHAFYWEDKLSLGGLVEQELHVWILEDYKNQKWAERKIIIPLLFLSEYPNKTDICPSSYCEGYERGFLWFISDDEDHIAYHIESQSVHVLNKLPEGKKNLYYMEPSLVNLEGFQPIIKKPKKKQLPLRFSLGWSVISILSSILFVFFLFHLNVSVLSSKS
ncbi:hypothetical protein ACH5RR_014929 [Cinchona calisaya]|uniref:F-box domain-containing protein n=1 Tax=Cinchona calisaya TaxID=153742 RepID=A0ABD2ZRN6_9GENT